MTSAFNFDTKALQRELTGLAQSQVNELSQSLTKELDGIHARLSGSSIQEINLALQSALARYDVHPNQEQLSEWALQIREGNRIVFKPEKIRH